ncbi:MAG: hypothetical protein ACFCUS_05780 [Rubrimonas sp.]
MKAFLAATVTAIVIAVAGHYFVDQLRPSSAAAYSSNAVRLD